MNHDRTPAPTVDPALHWSLERRRLLTPPSEAYDLSDLREVGEALTALERAAERPLVIPDPAPTPLPDPRTFALQLARARS
jgi:hypothetical protein